MVCTLLKSDGYLKRLLGSVDVLPVLAILTLIPSASVIFYVYSLLYYKVVTDF